MGQHHARQQPQHANKYFVPEPIKKDIAADQQEEHDYINMRDIIMGCPSPAIVSDMEGKIMLINTAMRAYLGNTQGVHELDDIFDDGNSLVHETDTLNTEIMRRVKAFDKQHIINISFASMDQVACIFVYLENAIEKQNNKDNASSNTNKYHELNMDTKLVGLSLIPVIAIDSVGQIMLFNNAACDTWGCTEEDVVGKNVKMLMPKTTAQQHDMYLQR